MSWTAHADLAEAAAVVLADEGRFDGPPPPLTGAEALDLADIALGFYRASRAGEFARVDPTLERLLGRRPMGMRELIAPNVNDRVKFPRCME